MPHENRLPGASVPTDAAAPPAGDLIGPAVEVLADGSGRVGLLTYQVPAGLQVAPGDAVDVPFGTSTRHGMVVGPAADPSKATKAVSHVWGKRSDPRDIALARSIATFHFADLATVLTRLAPRSGRGAEPLKDAVAALRPTVVPVRTAVDPGPRRLLVRAPLVDPAQLAAQEALQILARHPGGQVLILCPTSTSVTVVCGAFSSGAQRLDSRARKGAWNGFTAGTVAVGVGTRAAGLYSAAHLAGIIVVEEDHPGHLEASQPHTHARDVAAARARALHAELVLISANPTPAALGAGVNVGTAGTRADWPSMRVLDRGEVDPVTRWAPNQLRAAIAAENKEGRTPFVVAQRKAASRRCARCGAPRACPLCDSSLCRHQDSDPCPRCHSTDPGRVIGWDRARIEELLAPFGQVRVGHTNDLRDLRDVGLVVLFDVDAALSVPELIPESFGAGLIVAAATAAGRGGRVLALTDNPRAAALVDLFGPRDQMAVARRALAAAKSAALPPFGRLLTIKVAGDKAPSTAGWPGQVLGPARVGAEWELLVRIPADQLLSLTPFVTRLRRRGKVRVTVS